MVRITKTMQAKHSETLSPWIMGFRDRACSISLPQLPQNLESFPSRWPFPRGDLYHWIPLLNRFDAVLEKFCKTYGLDEGPQTVDFECSVLSTAKEGEGPESNNGHNLEGLGYSQDGDRLLIEAILNFSRVLLQNCGNRTIYASSAHLNNLLHTTSLSLLESTLLLGSELAQRYHAALKRVSMPVRAINAGLLANHYNFDLERVQQLSMPFSRTVTTSAESVQPTTPATPSAKGKEKAYFNLPTSSSKGPNTTVFASDLVSMVKGGNGIGSSPKNARSGVASGSSSTSETSWEDWGDVKVTYYPKSPSKTEPTGDSPQVSSPSTSAAPITPTPIRRSSNLGPHGQRANRQTSADESPASLQRASTFPSTNDDTPQQNFKSIEIPSSKIKSAGLHTLLRENIPGLPQELQYELLTKLRVAAALTSSLESRRKMLAIRLLAITNLAYIHPEQTFHENVMKQDADEPRRLQLVYQLAELVHPSAEGDIAIPRPLQTLAFSCLDALAGYSMKYQDVCAALNTNVNHGVLLYVVRKAVAEMNVEEEGDKTTEEDEWRDALFSLLSSLSVQHQPRTNADLVTAGLIQILVEVINLRTNIAERYYPMVLTFLDTIMYSARDAFQTLVGADGLDAVSELIVYEVKSASENAASGKGIKPEYRSTAVDYEIPFFQQQTLKWLFKFIHHLMSAGGGYGGNFDRLLRNLIDSSPLLAGLRQIIGNANCFGSVVWTNAVSILNDFINNEPTSFAVIAEAGLSRGLLEAVTGSPIIMSEEPKKDEAQSELSSDVAAAPSSPAAPTEDDDEDDDDSVDSDAQVTVAENFVDRLSAESLQAPREGPFAQGILPSSETIGIIPAAFDAICLNSAGMKMFQASKALEIFFEIFESPEHVKCMDSDKHLPLNLGASFDSLSRHHPTLKTAIMTAILNMVARVDVLCSAKAQRDGIGAKLLTVDASGKTVNAGANLIPDSSNGKGKGKAIDDGSDVEMRDADAESLFSPTTTAPVSITSDESAVPYITAVVSFLSGVSSNSSIRTEFCTQGGVEYLLNLAQSPCLPYDFYDSSASHTLRQVIGILAESKPHLTMPSLLKRACAAAEVLADFAGHKEETGFFVPFVKPDAEQDAEFLSHGTSQAKAFVSINSLVATIPACFLPSPFNHRSTNTVFTQINVTDYYVRLIGLLGPLYGASIREEMQLRKAVPDHWRNARRDKNFFLGMPAPDEVDATLGLDPSTPAEGSILRDSLLPDRETVNATSITPAPAPSPQKKATTPTKEEQDCPYFKNYIALRYLLSSVSRVVTPFFQTMGKTLLSKRSLDTFQKHSHATIADALAEATLPELRSYGVEASLENYTYWIAVLRLLQDLFIEDSRAERPLQILTLVLQSFKDRGGLEKINHMLEVFATEIQSRTEAQSTTSDKTTVEYLRHEMATGGIVNILSLYTHFVHGKNVTEAVQSLSLAAGQSERDRRARLFTSAQFLVELRMAILPTVRKLWGSDIIEKGPSRISKKLIEVIRGIAIADYEQGAVKRSDKPTAPTKPFRKTFKKGTEAYNALIASNSSPALANEALYRCNNNITLALEYCHRLNGAEDLRNPVPEGDTDTPVDSQAPSTHRMSDSTPGTVTPDVVDQTMGNDEFSGIIQAFNGIEAPATTDQTDPVDLNAVLSAVVPGFNPAASSSTPQPAPTLEEQPRTQVTIEDLNEEREKIRDDLMETCLEVINAHGDVTFEIADLIKDVMNKSSDPVNQRKSFAETLVIALMSFAGEEDLRTIGKTIAAYAHLLALMLRDSQFYSAAVEQLKENLSTLLTFVKLSPNHSSEESSPWIAHILLIVEMLLGEDARPQKTKWTPPKDENSVAEPPALELSEPVVPAEERTQLLQAILEILPRIGREESLALAVLRILVILTRTRSVAQTMGEKKNIQRLFVMAKQLAGASSARIQGPLLIILRHIIEDDETIKQIMRADIKFFLDPARAQRNMDEKLYLRSLSQVALRNPELFVEVTNEMVKFTRWTYSSPEAPSRHQTLVLKDFVLNPTSTQTSDDTVQPTVQATEDLTIQEVKPSTEAVDSEMPDAPKPAAPEHKLPVIENPDGVIHFLLCELLNYRDVEDKDPSVTPATASSADKPAASTNGDVNMAGTSSASEGLTPKDLKSKSSSKQDFKAEEHPIYIYRTFILQCLTELLASYNRTKIEFINFKRSAPLQPMTPSKPRSNVVNYLLFDLIPIGTLDHAENTTLKKKLVTSSWADSVLTALLSKTGEQSVDKTREGWDSENEPDLLFVRRFVLENILKAYKEASSSSEPLDARYSRMLGLADLMIHIMHGKENVGLSDTAVAAVSQKQLRRIMFDKGFVSALTASIADIDLNFPGAKRAVKYILRPLKTLTSTAIALSELALIKDTPGQVEDPEIESATSVSEDDEREETPDLFRNSTLGLFEPGREDDSSSEDEDDDEEMGYDEYGEEMDYDEEEPGDAEDNISDEDEDIEGMGPVEGLSGDIGVEVIMGDDDDDDEDEDDSSGDDDEEEDSEDDDARVEIIEEDETIRQVGADDEDIGEWESGEEDGEDDGHDEEGYEGPADDAREEQLRAMERHVMDGPLGNLVRALGGPDADDIEMLAEGDDEIEQHGVVAEYEGEGDEEEDDEDEDDMDEEDMFDQYGIDAAGGVTFGAWQEDEPQPPRMVVHSRRARGGFSPFPFIPGGPIPGDPLGGRSIVSLEDAQRELRDARAQLGEARATVLRIEDLIGNLDALGSRNGRTNPLAGPGMRPSSMLYGRHRSGGPAPPRSADDGINPLLQRNGPSGPGRDLSGRGPPTMGSWIQAMGGSNAADMFDVAFPGHPFGENHPAAAQLFDEIIRHLPPPGHPPRPGQALQFHIATGPGRQLPPDLEALFGGRPTRFESRSSGPEPGNATFFTPQSTATRWLEESKILFSSSTLERAADLANTILSLLVPPAIDADKAIKAAEAEKQKKAEQEAKKKAEEERIAREAKEAEEKAARERKEAEEREAAELAAAEAAAARGPEAEDAANEEVGETITAMEGVETEEPTGDAAELTEEPAADRPRVTTIIRGTPYDITDLGIDADFLAELPEEIREEVIMSAVAERRSQATATGAQPSEIDQEFLNALPDDIRDEIIQQERQDRRRREREEHNRAAAAANGGQPDMDAATILATLDPAFRNQVLMEQDDATLALLPPEMANQARAALRDHPIHGRHPRHYPPPIAREDAPISTQRPIRRAIVQMLDKPGVATLLRLMFIFQQGTLRSTLNSVLQNVCQNRHNRQEVLSTLLHILQDGSVDMPAVERSFAQLSLRAKQPKDAAPKTPQPLKKALTGLGTLAETNFEASPLMVVQQCLTALVYLNQVNPHAAAFFLTEHDSAGGLKRSLSRKGKGKENKATKYALNSLLILLDRDVIMESSTVMENLSTLLNMITSPLQALQRKQKEAEEAEKKVEEAPAVIDAAASVTSPEGTTSTTAEQPSEAQPEAAATSEQIATTEAPATENNATTAAESSPVAEAKPEAAKEPEKKQRPIVPPVIPEHNLKLVINIFVARECSSKTFRETLSTIKNLSAIPGAKAVFGKELIAKAQGLGEIILTDLEDLLPQIQKATTGTEIQGVALAKFSPGGSDQNKLLRVLTALDHLFDPKREKKDEKESESSQLVEKQDLLSSLYENPTFSCMWERLSACLSAIRQREHMLNVATILLPLIEALMVVCKNTTLKDAPISKSQIGKEMILTSPPPESHMENLFFTFTEEHRKILNDLVRHTPKLMSGTFSLLVKNPKVLEFDNKRNYFSRSIHNKAPNSRQSFPPLQLSVRRDQVFHDSFKSLYFQTGDQMKYGKLSIRFHGEEGVDAGGVTREWFQVLSRQMFDPGYALFIPVSSDRTTFHPNQLSSINEEHLMFFKFIGRIIGKALYEGRVLDCHFSRAVYKRILGKAVSIKDMESLDPEYHKSLVWMLENDITDIITETFSVDNDKFGVVETIDFIPNGRNVAVTEENKYEYVRLMVEWKLTGSVKEQLDEFLKGFHDIIPADLVAIFNEQELELLISGLPEIDVDDWKSNTEYHNYTASSPQIQWFWRAIRSYDKEERAKLLQFVTGTSKVPLNGFKELEGMNGFSRFNIHRDYGNKDRLPSSHTCFNQLDLPEYESYEALRQQVLTAITAGSEYFGFA